MRGLRRAGLALPAVQPTASGPNGPAVAWRWRSAPNLCAPARTTRYDGRFASRWIRRSEVRLNSGTCRSLLPHPHSPTARRTSEQRRQERIDASIASIRANTPPSAVLGGAPVAAPADSAVAAQQRAQAAVARQNRALREKLEREEEQRAQKNAAEARRREEDLKGRAAAGAAKEAAAKAQAKQVQRRVREQWGGEDGARIHAALSLLENHPDNDRELLRAAAAQLLRIITGLQRGAPPAPVPVDSPRLSSVHGALAVLLACRFQENQVHRTLDPPLGREVPPAAAVAQAIGVLTRLSSRS